jgi:PadR family transcriptional regulator AphA
MSLQYLILGLLKYGPMSGYDLNKAFQSSVKHFWETDQSLIYRALYKMHEAGWVEIDVVNQESLPAKKLYRLTDSGKQELSDWLRTPQTLPGFHEAWLGQLFFGAELNKEEIKRLLEARIVQLNEILARYENDVPPSAAYYADLFQAHNDMRFWLLALHYGIERMRFELKWAETALQNLQGDNFP